MDNSLFLVEQENHAKRMRAKGILRACPFPVCPHSLSLSLSLLAHL